MPYRNAIRDRIIAQTLAADPTAKTYPSTKPCRARGHVGERYISTGACVACATERNEEIKAALAAYSGTTTDTPPRRRRANFARGL